MATDLNGIQDALFAFEEQPQDPRRLQTLLDALQGLPGNGLTAYALGKARSFNSDPRILEALVSFLRTKGDAAGAVELLLGDASIPRDEWYKKTLAGLYAAMGLLHSAARVAGMDAPAPKIAVLIKRSADADELAACLAAVAAQSLPVARTYVAASCRGYAAVKGDFEPVGTATGIPLAGFGETLQSNGIEEVAVIDAAVRPSLYYLERNSAFLKRNPAAVITNPVQLAPPANGLQAWLAQNILAVLGADQAFKSDYVMYFRPAVLLPPAGDSPFASTDADPFFLPARGSVPVAENPAERVGFAYPGGHIDALERSWELRTRRQPPGEPASALTRMLTEPFNTFIQNAQKGGAFGNTMPSFLMYEGTFWYVFRNVARLTGETAFECLAVMHGIVRGFLLGRDEKAGRAQNVVANVILNDLEALVEAARTERYAGVDASTLVSYTPGNACTWHLPEGWGNLAVQVGGVFKQLIEATGTVRIATFLRTVIDLRGLQVRRTGEAADGYGLECVRGGAAAKLQAEHTYRNAVRVPLPGFTRYRHTVAAGDVLKYSFSTGTAAQGASFQVYVRDGDTVANPVYRNLNAAPGWCGGSISLEPFTGHEVHIITFAGKAPLALLAGAEHQSQAAPAEVSLGVPYVVKKRSDPRNIFIISLDALRADFLGCYGNPAGLTPNIDALAADSAVFKNAFSQTFWTLPSHMCMLSSQYVTRHGLYLDRKLKRSVPLVANYLKEAGYQTYGAVSHIRLSPDYGYARGFDTYTLGEGGSAPAKIQEAMQYLELNRDFNNFLFLHYFDVHSPYMPKGDTSLAYNPRSYRRPPEFNTLARNGRDDMPEEDVLAFIRNEYAGELRQLDLALGNLFNYLKAAGLYDNSMIIVTADHGEEFKEHRSFHHDALYNEVLHVPLIIKFPQEFGLAGTCVDNLVSAGIDLAPTINEVAFPERHIPDFAGKSLVPYGSGFIPVADDETVISEMIPYNDNKLYKIAIQTPHHKYIYTTVFDTDDFKNFTRNDEVHELYDLAADPGEKVNIAAAQPGLTGEFNGKAMAFINETLEKLKNEKAEELAEIKHDEIVQARLEALGYV